MIITITGHRPNKIGGYDPEAPLRRAVKAALRAAFEHYKPEGIITGLALGVDQDAALIAKDMGIPYIGVAPFHGQENKWPEASQRLYHEICGDASGPLLEELLERYPSQTGLRSPDYEGVYVVTDDRYQARYMQDRNIWMVNRGDLVIAVWDGDPRGGTANCINYVNIKGKTYYQINPNTLR